MNSLLRVRFFAFFALIFSGVLLCAASAPTRQQRLLAARNWAYQIQRIDEAGSVDALAAARYDVLVIEPTRSERGNQDFPAKAVVTRLKNSPGSRPGSKKIVLAYVAIGEAEDWRAYWQKDWQKPAAAAPGKPDFIVAADPDGWSGDYPVAFWDPRWQAILATGPASQLRQALADGFDGIYMDWVEAYECGPVVAAAKRAGRNPENEMVSFVKLIRQTARATDPEFLVVPQNCAELGRRADYLVLCDAIGQEDVFFSGKSDTKWGAKNSGDIRTSNADRQEYFKQLAVWKRAGKPVLQISYALKPQNIEESYKLGAEQGYITFVSQTPLDRLPPWHEVK